MKPTWYCWDARTALRLLAQQLAYNPDTRAGLFFASHSIGVARLPELFAELDRLGVDYHYNRPERLVRLDNHAMLFLRNYSEAGWLGALTFTDVVIFVPHFAAGDADEAIYNITARLHPMHSTLTRVNE